MASTSSRVALRPLFVIGYRGRSARSKPLLGVQGSRLAVARRYLLSVIGYRLFGF
jgi:hypothetical protein